MKTCAVCSATNDYAATSCMECCVELGPGISRYARDNAADRPSIWVIVGVVVVCADLAAEFVDIDALRVAYPGEWGNLGGVLYTIVSLVILIPGHLVSVFLAIFAIRKWWGNWRGVALLLLCVTVCGATLPKVSLFASVDRRDAEARSQRFNEIMSPRNRNNGMAPAPYGRK
jgi:hypothetical protein